MSQESLQLLVAKLTKIKLKISKLNAEKAIIDNDIALHFKNLPDEGTTHLFTEDGKQDISATTKLNYSLDTEAYNARDKQLLPKNVAPVVEKFSLDLKAYRLLEKINPEAYAEAQKFVTTKPVKTSISVKDVKKK
jgi:uncharacterized protein YwgA